MHIMYLVGKQQYCDNKFRRHVYDSNINKGLPVPFTCSEIIHALQYNAFLLAAIQMQKMAFVT